MPAVFLTSFVTKLTTAPGSIDSHTRSAMEPQCATWAAALDMWLGTSNSRESRCCGLDLSPRMLDQARKLNPDILFREGNMLSLDIPEGSLAGITAFYAIVNIPSESLQAVFPISTIGSRIVR